MYSVAWQLLLIIYHFQVGDIEQIVMIIHITAFYSITHY